MKKNFLYALCILFFATIGCNDNNKKADADTRNTNSAEDSVLAKMKAYFASPIEGFDPQATIKNLDKYPDLYDKTKTVNFLYNNLSLFIDSLDLKFPKPATNISFTFGAYTPDAVRYYLENHKTLGKDDSLSILNKPCLVLSYKDTSGAFIYSNSDIGTICPPPNSCESFASYPSFSLLAPKPGFDPAAVIANYKLQYEVGKKPPYPLTQRVRFDIAAIRFLMDSLRRSGTISTTDIYLAIGAYTAADAERYVKNHPPKKGEGPIQSSDIVDRICLLLAYKKSGTKPGAAPEFFYFDIGTICPPPNSCETEFMYNR